MEVVVGRIEIFLGSSIKKAVRLGFCFRACLGFKGLGFKCLGFKGLTVLGSGFNGSGFRFQRIEG